MNIKTVDVNIVTDNGIPTHGVLAGKVEGIINSPLFLVWNGIGDFFDLSWWKEYDAVKPAKPLNGLSNSDNVRIRMEGLAVRSIDTLIETKISPTLCYQVYTEEPRYEMPNYYEGLEEHKDRKDKTLKLDYQNPDMRRYFSSIKKITTTLQVQKITEDRTLFQFFTYHDGPFHVVRNSRVFFERY